LKEAQVLFEHGCFEGAYYLVGYVIECALKSCIAKQIKEHDFPDLKLVKDSYTHDLDKLLSISGLRNELEKEVKTNPRFNIDWAIIKNWSEESRYRTSIDENTVRDLFDAVAVNNGGVLAWLKSRW